MLVFAELTWTEVDALDRDRAVPLLPVGATEAHGPHLPLNTDVLIAEAMCAEAGRRLGDVGLIPLLLPAVAYTAAPFASGFSGTVSVGSETITALVAELGESLRSQGFRWLGVANAHFDPAHVGCLYRARDQIEAQAGLTVVFPDLTRRRLASRLTEEFQSGACHAGRYEGSIVLAARPDLVRADRQAGLPAHPVSLAAGIREGKRSFEELGGDRAYFGDPAAATAEEGQQTLEVLGELLAEAILEARGTGSPAPSPAS